MTIADHPAPPPERPSMPEALARAARAVDDKKAVELVALDLRPVDAFTDWFLICSGHTQRHVKAIADGVEEALRSLGVRPAHIEGDEGAYWILLDYFDFIVHIFRPEARAFYALERLWGSATPVDLAPVLAAPSAPLDAATPEAPPGRPGTGSPPVAPAAAAPAPHTR